MSGFKKIMAALGITEYSQGIFNYAVKLGKALDSELLAVNIINSRDVDAVSSIISMGYDVDGEHYIQNVKEERQKFLENIINQSDFPREKIRVIIKVGNPVDTLLQIILKEEPDMIVMGPKGRTDLEHIIVGSVASKMFRRSPITLVSYRDDKLAAQLRKKINMDE